MTAGRPGIRRFGAYLPRLRLERKAIAAATAFATGSRAGAAKGTRSCCNWDEDSLTMAVEAARDCLAGIAAPAIDSLTFASTSHAFADRSNAGVVATALNLDESLRVADAGGPPALGRRRIDRCPDAGRHEFDFGRRGRSPAGQAGQRTGILVRSWCCRTARGYGHGCCRRAGSLRLPAGRFRRPLPQQRRALRLRARRALGARRGLRQDRAAGHCGCTRTGRDCSGGHRQVHPAGSRAVRHGRGEGGRHQARGDPGRPACAVRQHGRRHPLLQLGAALETARAGEIILLASFGQGSDALVLRATGRSPGQGRGAAGAFAEGVSDGDYVRFLANCGLRRHRLGHARRARQPHGAIDGLAQAQRRDRVRRRSLHDMRHGAVPPLARLRES